MNLDSKYLGRFVTAKLMGLEDCRQGWVIELCPFIIQGESGDFYQCEGTPIIVKNPPPINRPAPPNNEGETKVGYCNKHDAYNGNGHCEWCDREKEVGTDISQLMKFYNVGELIDLISAMEKHIESLQASRRPEGSQGQYYFTKAREG